MRFETHYLSGRLGAVVIRRDGTRTEYPPHALVRLDRGVRQVIGRLYSLRAEGRLAYETPELAPAPPPKGTRR